MDKKENMLKIKQSLTLLYVEDETMVKEASVKSLRRRFKEVYTANDGKEGLELYKKYKPDIVLTDILMQAHSGLEMIKQIREIDKNVLVVVITALTESIYLKQAEELGYFVKPLKEEQFLELLYNLSLGLINYGND
ncbi:response regulator transcription factor [Candidatus Magnetobacterium casense]|uniref:Response regulator n=1 Tax=Candidatus Magnetobacterium casense TaxID=1455061 RepID=A0ABS6RUH9_9BACT|nr:response regulator [Candidatus Magnetobacterium casensis]MBV6340274.1 response regulator [Candidatus Magnetobacterium casensis]